MESSVLQYLVREVHRRNMKTLVVSQALNDKNKQEVDPYCKLAKTGLKIYFVYAGGLMPEEVDRSGCVELVRCKNLFSAIFRIIKLIRDEKIDFVVNSTSSVKNLLLVLLISKLCPVTPIVRIEADTPTAAIYQEKTGVIKVIKRFVYPRIWRMCISNSSGVIALSRYLRYLAIKYGAKKVVVVSQGVDTNLFKPMNGKKGWDLLYVGRISKEKNLPMLFEVFRELKREVGDLRLCIVGDGPERENLEREYSGDGVFFAGYVEHNDLPKFYNMAKIFVLASLSEGLPTVIMEAMACGLPVVATDVGGVSEIVLDGKTGFVVSLEDEDNFRSKLRLLLTEAKLRARIGKNSMRFIMRKHSIIKIWGKLRKFLEEVRSYE